MNRRKGVILSKERELKRKKIIQDMLLAISFSDKKKKNTVVKKKKRPVPSQDNVQSHDNSNNIEDNPFSLSNEEKKALDIMVKQIQSFDADEMHELTYDSMEGLSVESEADFLGFDADFDPVMLWKDTNLDDYADLFSTSELKMLKEKQQQLINYDSGKIVISEDDFEEEIISEDDYSDNIVSEDDFE